MTISETKFCRDCRFCERGWFERLIGSYEYARCDSPNTRRVQTVSLVSGKTASVGDARRYCDNIRTPGHACGGEFWEQKP